MTAQDCNRILPAASRGLFVAATVAVLAIMAGCGPAAPPPEPDSVHGRVTFKGKPVGSGKIIFSSDPAKGFTGADGWAPILDGVYDTNVGGYGTRGGKLVARLEGGLPGAPQGELLFSNYDAPVEVPKGRFELNFDVPASAGK